MGVAQKLAGVLMGLFLLGTVGATAVVMASNETAYAGAPTAVITLWCVGVPAMAGIAAALYFLPRRALAFSPVLAVVIVGSKAKGYVARLIKKLGRN
jgi:hypothetical protein